MWVFVLAALWIGALVYGMYLVTRFSYWLTWRVFGLKPAKAVVVGLTSVLAPSVLALSLFAHLPKSVDLFTHWLGYEVDVAPFVAAIMILGVFFLPMTYFLSELEVDLSEFVGAPVELDLSCDAEDLVELVQKVDDLGERAEKATSDGQKVRAYYDTRISYTNNIATGLLSLMVIIHGVAGFFLYTS